MQNLNAPKIEAFFRDAYNEMGSVIERIVYAKCMHDPELKESIRMSDVHKIHKLIKKDATREVPHARPRTSIGKAEKARRLSGKNMDRAVVNGVELSKARAVAHAIKAIIPTALRNEPVTPANIMALFPKVKVYPQLAMYESEVPASLKNRYSRKPLDFIQGEGGPIIICNQFNIAMFTEVMKVCKKSGLKIKMVKK